MALLKSINRYSAAPLAPAELPENALMLVEIDGRVFRIAASDVGGGGGEPVELPGWVTEMPTADPEVAGQVYASGDTLLVSEGGGG